MFRFIKQRATDQMIWDISIVITVILAISIAALLYSEHRYYKPNEDQLTTNAQVNNFLNEYQSSLPQGKDFAAVPTGMFIQSIHFEDANTFHASGYVWQKYTKGEHDHLSKGFVLPEAINTVTKQVYRKQVENHEIIGWYFESEIIEKFDYSKYPLDNKTVWLRLWHADIDQNAILTPDLAAYQSTDLHDVFGLDDQLVLPGFNIKETFYSYKRLPYDATLGLDNINYHLKPELYFNISIKRKFSNAFFMHFMPVILVTLIAFALCLNINIENTNKSRYQSSIADMIAVCTALTFVVVLIHLNLRSQTIGGEIVYIEYIYLLVITTVTFLCFNAVAVANPQTFLARSLCVFYHNNLIVKALYWPVFLGMMLIITLLVI